MVTLHGLTPRNSCMHVRLWIEAPDCVAAHPGQTERSQRFSESGGHTTWPNAMICIPVDAQQRRAIDAARERGIAALEDVRSSAGEERMTETEQVLADSDESDDLPLSRHTQQHALDDSDDDTDESDEEDLEQ